MAYGVRTLLYDTSFSQCDYCSVIIVAIIATIALAMPAEPRRTSTMSPRTRSAGWIMPDSVPQYGGSVIGQLH